MATRSAPCRASGRERPLLAWPLTIAMLGLAGLPATAGFIGKLYLIEALVEGSYTWLAVFIAVGTMISLAYYLRVVAAMWMRPGDEPAVGAAATPAIAGASPEADPIDPEAGNRLYLARPGPARRGGRRLLRHHPPAPGRLRPARRRLDRPVPPLSPPVLHHASIEIEPAEVERATEFWVLLGFTRSSRPRRSAAPPSGSIGRGRRST